MADEPSDEAMAQDQAAEPRRVRRRRSSKRSRRSKRVQGRIPFTGLRFMRPRLPTPDRLLGLAVAVLALGLSGWAMRAADVAGVTLAQTQAQLAVNTRGAAAGRMAADRLAAQAQADAAQVMAEQDMAQRQAARASSSFGFAPPGAYARSSQEDQAGGSNGSTSASYGPMPYGSAPYGSMPYGATGYGTPRAGAAPAASGGNAMGYTLPQTTTPQ